MSTIGQRLIQELADSSAVMIKMGPLDMIDAIRFKGVSLMSDDDTVPIDILSQKGIDLNRQDPVPDFVQMGQVEDICESPVLFTISSPIDDRAWVRLNQPSGRPPRRLSQGQSRSK